MSCLLLPQRLYDHNAVVPDLTMFTCLSPGMNEGWRPGPHNLITIVDLRQAE